jgi:hypothetical protein
VEAVVMAAVKKLGCKHDGTELGREFTPQKLNM